MSQNILVEKKKKKNVYQKERKNLILTPPITILGIINIMNASISHN